jgi:hypothetical protein
MSENEKPRDRYVAVTTMPSPDGHLHFTRCPQCKCERVGYRNFAYKCSKCGAEPAREQLEMGARIV